MPPWCFEDWFMLLLIYVFSIVICSGKDLSSMSFLRSLINWMHGSKLKLSYPGDIRRRQRLLQHSLNKSVDIAVEFKCDWAFIWSFFGIILIGFSSVVGSNNSLRLVKLVGNWLFPKISSFLEESSKSEELDISSLSSSEESSSNKGQSCWRYESSKDW